MFLFKTPRRCLVHGAIYKIGADARGGGLLVVGRFVAIMSLGFGTALKRGRVWRDGAHSCLIPVGFALMYTCVR